MSYLLDTNVVSQFGKRSPNRNVMEWAAQQPERNLFLSTITLRELWYGVEKARMSRHADAEALAAQVIAVCEVYGDRILPIDERVARVWATMLAQSYKHIDDTGLAATAAVHGLVVVTRNVAHLRGRGVPVLDPFRSPPVIVSPAI